MCYATPPPQELSIQNGRGLADFILRNKKLPTESRAAQDTRLCGAHNQVAGIARPSKWHTELHEAAEQNSIALNASLDVHRTSTQLNTVPVRPTPQWILRQQSPATVAEGDILRTTGDSGRAVQLLHKERPHSSWCGTRNSLHLIMRATQACALISPAVLILYLWLYL